MLIIFQLLAHFLIPSHTFFVLSHYVPLWLKYVEVKSKKFWRHIWEKFKAHWFRAIELDTLKLSQNGKRFYLLKDQNYVDHVVQNETPFYVNLQCTNNM